MKTMFYGTTEENTCYKSKQCPGLPGLYLAVLHFYDCTCRLQFRAWGVGGLPTKFGASTGLLNWM